MIVAAVIVLLCLSTCGLNDFTDGKLFDKFKKEPGVAMKMIKDKAK